MSKKNGNKDPKKVKAMKKKFEKDYLDVPGVITVFDEAIILQARKGGKSKPPKFKAAKIKKWDSRVSSTEVRLDDLEPAVRDMLSFLSEQHGIPVLTILERGRKFGLISNHPEASWSPPGTWPVEEMPSVTGVIGEPVDAG